MPASADPVERSLPPGWGGVVALAFAITLVPGILVFAVLHARGLSLGAASLFGLLAVFLGMIAYPLVLRQIFKAESP
jgi:hypothetical protein